MKMARTKTCTWLLRYNAIPAKTTKRVRRRSAIETAGGTDIVSRYVKAGKDDATRFGVLESLLQMSVMKISRLLFY